MNALADRVAGQDVGSIFLYTHEAHPGEHYPHLTSMEQKFRHANLMRDLLGVTRPILVDALDGACHRAYGSMPNMTWIFNRSGLPIYKSDWTDSTASRMRSRTSCRCANGAKRANGWCRSALSAWTIGSKIARRFIAVWSVTGQKPCENTGRRLVSHSA